MKLNNQILIGFAFVLIFIITVNCQVEKNVNSQTVNNKVKTATLDESKLRIHTAYGSKDHGSPSSSVSTSSISKNKSVTSKKKNGTVSIKTKGASTKASVKSTTKIVSTTTKVAVNTPTKDDSTENTTYNIRKAKAEALEKYPIDEDDLTLLKWGEFDYNGFKITISTPKEFNDNAVVNIKWQTAANVKLSSTIKIELHTNLTRRNDFTVYPTTETITIDDSIPADIKEVNWNPNIKFKKNEKYYIRIWAYINNNTATMSGLCIWSINDLIEEEVKETNVSTKKGVTVKSIAFPCIGALLSFTVIGHFVMQSREQKRYYKRCSNDEESVTSQDGLNDNKGESNNYNTIQIDGSESYHQLPQLWQLEAKKKQNMINHEESLSDGNSVFNRDNSNNLDEQNAQFEFDNTPQKPFSIIIEKPEQQKLQKITKYEIDNTQGNTYQGSTYQEHRASNNSDNVNLRQSSDIRRSIVKLFRNSNSLE